MKRLWHTIARSALVGGALVPIYLSYLWPFLRLRWLGIETPRLRWSRLHSKNADRYFRMAVRMRGALIKVGQIISVRVDIAPPEWTERLSALQDMVPAAPWRVIEHHLAAELGAPPDEVFAHIDHEAVAAASFGQVHRARTHDGRDVALKIFVDGVFQSDPHPGNLMFRRTLGREELCFLDFGQVKELPPDFQQKLLLAAVAFAGRDAVGFERGLVGLGMLSPEDGVKLQPVLQDFFDRYFEMSPREAREVDFAAIRADVRDTLAEIEGITIPNDIVLYGRTFALLTFVISQLDENVNGFEVAKPMIMQALMKPAAPTRAGAAG